MTNGTSNVGGNLTLIAGYDFTGPTTSASLPPNQGLYTLTQPDMTPGNITLSATTINTNTAGTGGNVNLYATGTIALTGSTTIDTSGGTGTSGNVNIIGNGVSASGITTAGTSTNGDGSVSITIAPVAFSNASVTGGALSGGVAAGTPPIGTAYGNLSVGNINAGGATVTLTATGAGSTINGIASTTIQAGTLNVAGDAGVGQTQTLNTNAGTLVLNSASGAVAVTDSNAAIALNSSGSSTGLALTASNANAEVTIPYGQLITGNVNISGAAGTNLTIDVIGAVGNANSGNVTFQTQDANDVGGNLTVIGTNTGSISGTAINVTATGSDVLSTNGVKLQGTNEFFGATTITADNAAGQFVTNVSGIQGFTGATIIAAPTVTNASGASLITDALTLNNVSDFENHGSISASGNVTVNSGSGDLTVNNYSTGSVTALGYTIAVNGNTGNNVLINNAGTFDSGSGSINITSTSDGTNGGNITFAQPGSDTAIGSMTANTIAITATTSTTAASGVTFNTSQNFFNPTSTGTTTISAFGPNQFVNIANNMTLNEDTGMGYIKTPTDQFLPGQLTTSNGGMWNLVFPDQKGTIESSNTIDLSQFNSGSININASNLTIISEGSIIDSGNANGASITLLQPTTGAGGNLTLIAGYDVTPSTGTPSLPPDAGTYTIGAATGGSIDLGNTTIDTSGTTTGGSVSMYASGSIALTGNTTVNTAGGSGASGSFTAIGNGFTASNTTAGTNTISTQSNGAGADGNITINAATPTFGGAGTIVAGALTTTPTAGLAGGNISVGSLNANTGTVTLTAAGTTNSVTVTPGATVTSAQFNATAGSGGISAPGLTAGQVTLSSTGGAVTAGSTSMALTITGTNSGLSYSVTGSGAITVNGAVTSTGAISLNAATDLTVASTGSVSATGAGTVTLETGAANTLTVQGSGSVSGNGGVLLETPTVANSGSISAGSANTLSITSTGNLAFSGNGTYTGGAGFQLSAAGNVDLGGLLTLNSGNYVFDTNGSNLVVVAGGNITAINASATTGSINLSGTGSSGNMQLIAGATSVAGLNSLTIFNGGLASGVGNIILDGTNGGVPITSIVATGTAGAGGNVTLVANGLIAVPTSGTISLGGTVPTGTTNNGDLTVFTTGTMPGASAISLGAINQNASATAAGTGTVDLETGTQSFLFAGPLTFTNGLGNNAIVNTFGGNGNISTGAITSDVGAVTIKAANNISIGATSGVNSLTLNATTGTVTVPTNVISAAASSTGAGGTISISSTGKVTISGGGILTLDANGTGSGAGGSVTYDVNSATNLAIGTDVIVNALGGTTGSGGSATVLTQGALTVNTADLLTTPGTGGNGGKVLLTGATIANAGTGPLILTETGNGSGNGGRISVTTTSGSALAVGNATGTVGGNSNLELNAQGTSGGELDVTSGGNLTVNPTYLVAGPYGTNGAGGTVKLAADGNVVISAALAENGKGTGAGGVISVTSDSSTAFTIGSSTANGINGAFAVAGTPNGTLTVTNNGTGGITDASATFFL